MDGQNWESTSVQAVLNAEDARRQALLAGDVAALQALLAEDLVYVHSSAASDSKASYLAKLGSGSLRYLSLQFDDLQARAVGECVVVTGSMKAEVSKDGQSRQVRSLFMTLWARSSGAHALAPWQMQAHQGTPLPL
jgi:ketosteroid isomerase-like protein